ncbi:hypothetical protein HGB07_03640 [Candidatus Roizmanbacteria bacterium]|nr:hypothetical protein [Candidatus Roizmanbacteria bacterium]
MNPQNYTAFNQELINTVDKLTNPARQKGGAGKKILAFGILGMISLTAGGTFVAMLMQSSYARGQRQPVQHMEIAKDGTVAYPTTTPTPTEVPDSPSALNEELQSVSTDSADELNGLNTQLQGL